MQYRNVRPIHSFTQPRLNSHALINDLLTYVHDGDGDGDDDTMNNSTYKMMINSTLSYVCLLNS